jgi:hypothetical protein
MHAFDPRMDAQNRLEGVAEMQHGSLTGEEVTSLRLAAKARTAGPTGVKE